MTVSSSASIASLLLGFLVWVGIKFAETANVVSFAIIMFESCTPSSETGAEKARSLSQVELRGLYLAMEQYKKEKIEWDAHIRPLPDEFARLGALYGDVRGLDRLVFGGCFDDKASLMFDGLRGDGPRQIRLIPGERMATEVLWQDRSENIK